MYLFTMHRVNTHYTPLHNSTKYKHSLPSTTLSDIVNHTLQQGFHCLLNQEYH